ncbi:protein translocase subunit SecF [Pseudenhygromyxa sp. WMMC2535]|uniref:protein translocase subunit SecF n=1 Tax=Pseudenhygromyxa sp. WMMC2535 TaxID=2712867 RepID=UPI001556A1A2|nr:protein translocase subunit SecF [Pseudenhygromyxa sp. WMMC2535]NVB41471.1 protein translocase subunit SecF [Pseudenhygromyxa sp. WMMC2535]
MADNDNTQTPESENTSGADRRRRRGSRSAKKPAAPDPSKLEFFTLVPTSTNLNFVGRRKLWLMVSIFAVLLSIGTMVVNSATKGSALNFGIDFQGGSSIRLALTTEPDVEELRGILDEAGYAGSSVVSVPDADQEVLIRVKEVIAISDAELEGCREALSGLEGASLLPEEEQGFFHPTDGSKIFMKFDAQPAYADIERLMGDAGCEGAASAGVTSNSQAVEGEATPVAFPVEFALIGVGADISKVIDDALGAGTVDHIVASETVGAKVGSQLKVDGVKSMIFAIFFIFLFVMIRFDLRFAPGGIVALAHDAIIVVGAFALTGKEFNLQSIAALLTIIGYSINDTIVVFDRVRERVAMFRDDPIEETTNSALNETLSRTLLTSTTTILVVLATWILGSGPIKDFSFALFVGLIVGTYSSLCVASPVFLWVNEKIYKGKGHLITADNDAERGTGTLLGGPQVEAGGEDEGEAEVEEPRQRAGGARRRRRGPAASAAAGGATATTNSASSADDDADDDDDADGDASEVEAEGDSEIADALDKVSNVDKDLGERKSRRRRRPTK